ncbi:hypothetical protein SRHO_G00278610 [Serrasalmus rhombeus]
MGGKLQSSTFPHSDCTVPLSHMNKSLSGESLKNTCSKASVKSRPTYSPVDPLPCTVSRIPHPSTPHPAQQVIFKLFLS